MLILYSSILTGALRKYFLFVIYMFWLILIIFGVMKGSIWCCVSSGDRSRRNSGNLVYPMQGIPFPVTTRYSGRTPGWSVGRGGWYKLKFRVNPESRSYSTLNGRGAKKDPWFITGLIDAEGCFRVNIVEDTKNRCGWLIQPSFQIDLHERDIILIQQVQSFFYGCGKIYTKQGGQLTYRVSSLAQIVKMNIIPLDY